MGSTRAGAALRSVRRLTPVVVLLTLAAVWWAPAAGADADPYVESRFTAPEPGGEYAWSISQYAPRVSAGQLAYCEVDGDETHTPFVWTIGEATATAWSAPGTWNMRNPDHSYSDGRGLLVYQVPGETGHDEVWASDGATTIKVNEGTDHARFPRIDGDIVVWQQFVNDRWDIMAARIAADSLAVTKRTTVCGARGDQARPDISGTVVVWQDLRSGQWDIYGRDLTQRAEIRICGAYQAQTSPSVCDGWVAWEDKRNWGHGTDIYASRFEVLSSGWRVDVPRRVCRVPGDQTQPRVGQDCIVWTDWRDADPRTQEIPDTDIRVYRIAARRTFKLTSGTAMQTDPDVDGLTVVYTAFDDTSMGQPAHGRVAGAVLRP